jgi:hypothetical protein
MQGLGRALGGYSLEEGALLLLFGDNKVAALAKKLLGPGRFHLPIPKMRPCMQCGCQPPSPGNTC